MEVELWGRFAGMTCSQASSPMVPQPVLCLGVLSEIASKFEDLGFKVDEPNLAASLTPKALNPRGCSRQCVGLGV